MNPPYVASMVVACGGCRSFTTKARFSRFCSSHTIEYVLLCHVALGTLARKHPAYRGGSGGGGVLVLTLAPALSIGQQYRCHHVAEPVMARAGAHERLDFEPSMDLSFSVLCLNFTALAEHFRYLNINLNIIGRTRGRLKVPDAKPTAAN